METIEIENKSYGNYDTGRVKRFEVTVRDHEFSATGVGKSARQATKRARAKLAAAYANPARQVTPNHDRVRILEKKVVALTEAADRDRVQSHELSEMFRLEIESLQGSRDKLFARIHQLEADGSIQWGAIHVAEERLDNAVTAEAFDEYRRSAWHTNIVPSWFQRWERELFERLNNPEGILVDTDANGCDTEASYYVKPDWNAVRPDDVGLANQLAELRRRFAEIERTFQPQGGVPTWFLDWKLSTYKADMLELLDKINNQNATIQENGVKAHNKSVELTTAVAEVQVALSSKERTKAYRAAWVEDDDDD